MHRRPGSVAACLTDTANSYSRLSAPRWWCASRPSVRLPPAILHTEVPMRRIGLAVVLALSLTLAPLSSEAQQAGKMYRIGYLDAGDASRDRAAGAAADVI
jgi:hypothetical protein